MLTPVKGGAKGNVLVKMNYKSTSPVIVDSYED